MKSSRVMTERQFKALTRAAALRRYPTAHRDRFLFYFLGKTGLRISEALKLTPGCLWLDAEPAFVRVVTLKQRKGPRVDEVYLDEPTARAARAHLTRTLPGMVCDSKGFPAPYPKTGPLFPARGPFPAGILRPFTRRNALSLFRTYARLAGLPASLSVHSLRHLRATILLRNTRDLEFTRGQLRHSSIKSTEAYLHADPELVKDYLKKTEGDA